MDEEITQIQLTLIREITHLLSTINIPHWLVGGWAVDFLVGRVTRVHHDIDWSIWKADRERVATQLQQAGYERRHAAFPHEKYKYTKAGQEITFFFLQQNAEGHIINPGRLEEWPWPEDSFTAANIGDVYGIRCPVVSAVGQLDAKENQPGGPQRTKNFADIIELRKLLNV